MSYRTSAVAPDWNVVSEFFDGLRRSWPVSGAIVLASGESPATHKLFTKAPHLRESSSLLSFCNEAERLVKKESTAVQRPRTPPVTEGPVDSSSNPGGSSRLRLDVCLAIEGDG